MFGSELVIPLARWTVLNRGRLSRVISLINIFICLSILVVLSENFSVVSSPKLFPEFNCRTNQFEAKNQCNLLSDKYINHTNLFVT